MPAIVSPPLRNRPRMTLAAGADGVLLLLITLGCLFPRLTENAYYWPVVAAAAVVLVPVGLREYDLAIARLRHDPRRWTQVGRSLVGAVVPAVGAAVVCATVFSVGAMFDVIDPDEVGAVFYVVLCAGVVFALSVLMGADERLPARRRAHGHCPHCGYDLRAQYARGVHAEARVPHAVGPTRADWQIICPECGLSPDDLFASPDTQR